MDLALKKIAISTFFTTSRKAIIANGNVQNMSHNGLPNQDHRKVVSDQPLTAPDSEGISRVHDYAKDGGPGAV